MEEVSRQEVKSTETLDAAEQSGPSTVVLSDSDDDRKISDLDDRQKLIYLVPAAMKPT